MIHYPILFILDSLFVCNLFSNLVSLLYICLHPLDFPIPVFTLFDKIAVPKIKTIYKILTYEEKEQEQNENGLITVEYKIKILGIGNPRPEKLFIINI